MTMKYLIFNAEINERTANVLTADIVDAINDENVSAVTVAFSSVGGQVVYGVSLHHLIRSSSKPVTMHGIGNVDSIGLTVFLGAKHRKAVPGTRFFFHSMGANNSGQRLDIPALTSLMAGLKSDEARVTSIWMGSDTKLEQSEAISLFESEHSHDCDWALSRGFVHEITDFYIPASAWLKPTY